MEGSELVYRCRVDQFSISMEVIVESHLLLISDFNFLFPPPQ
jgi:hypothetical protein